VPPSVGVARARARGELLARSLSAEVGEPLIVEVAEDYAILERRVLEASVELAWTPAAICADAEADAHAIWKAVREGRSSYRSALVARKEAHLALEKLQGTRAAWVDRLSVGGYLLVARHLRERGIDLDRTFASQVFAGTHPAALTAVLDGEADVAAVSVPGPHEEQVEQALALHAGRAGAQQLRALAVTDAAPNDGLLFTRALDAKRAAEIMARLFPESGRSSALCLAMESEGFERARPGEYAPLKGLKR
jgi:phosphonate transport system substrate-binding protein